MVSMQMPPTYGSLLPIPPTYTSVPTNPLMGRAPFNSSLLLPEESKNDELRASLIADIEKTREELRLAKLGMGPKALGAVGAQGQGSQELIVMTNPMVRGLDRVASAHRLDRLASAHRLSKRSLASREGGWYNPPASFPCGYLDPTGRPKPAEDQATRREAFDYIFTLCDTDSDGFICIKDLIEGCKREFYIRESLPEQIQTNGQYEGFFAGLGFRDDRWFSRENFLEFCVFDPRALELFKPFAPSKLRTSSKNSRHFSSSHTFGGARDQADGTYVPYDPLVSLAGTKVWSDAAFVYIGKAQQELKLIQESNARSWAELPTVFPWPQVSPELTLVPVPTKDTVDVPASDKAYYDPTMHPGWEPYRLFHGLPI